MSKRRSVQLADSRDQPGLEEEGPEDLMLIGSGD